MTSNTRLIRKVINQIKKMNGKQFGARLNTLRNQIKDIKARRTFGNSTLTTPLVKVDANNMDTNLQEIKLVITPDYSKMQQKIKEYKQVKLHKTKSDKQNLSDKRFQLETSQELEDKMATLNKSKSSTSFLEVPQPKIPTKTVKKMFPRHMLREDSEEDSFKFQRCSTNSSKHKKQILQVRQDFKAKQYRKLGQTDKYCEQFMNFLDENNDSLTSMEQDKITIKLQVSIEWYSNQDQKTIKEEEQTVDITDRVRLAIHNSLRLMKGLKYRHSQLPQ